MKRTPIKRGAPCLARTGSLNRIGARGLREQPAIDAFREAVLLRAGYRCERCGGRYPLHAHHVLPRSRGGAHTIENGRALCGGTRGCHQLVHERAVADWSRWIR